MAILIFRSNRVLKYVKEKPSGIEVDDSKL
jgi:hypothetical protein